MGTTLRLEPDNGKHSLDREAADAYHNYRVQKARNYRPAPDDEDPDADWYRGLISAKTEERESGRTLIRERWLSSIRNNANVGMSDLVDSDSDELVIYSEDIQTFIGRLREGKERMKQWEEDCTDFWDRYFELRLIALCEFALENGHGVRLSV